MTINPQPTPLQQRIIDYALRTWRQAHCHNPDRLPDEFHPLTIPISTPHPNYPRSVHLQPVDNQYLDITIETVRLDEFGIEHPVPNQTHTFRETLPHAINFHPSIHPLLARRILASCETQNQPTLETQPEAQP